MTLVTYITNYLKGILKVKVIKDIDYLNNIGYFDHVINKFLYGGQKPFTHKPLLTAPTRLHLIKK